MSGDRLAAPGPLLRWCVGPVQEPGCVNIALGELWGRLQTRELVGYEKHPAVYIYSPWADMPVAEIFPA